MAEYQLDDQLNYQLKAQSALGGVALDFKQVSLTEVTDLAIASLACGVNAVDKLAVQVKTALQADLPSVGQVTLSADGRYTLLGLQRDQWFVIAQRAASDAENGLFSQQLAAVLGETAYLTEQSDSWAALRLSGPGGRRALERLCMPDLHPAVFPVQRVLRTTFEHLSVILLHEGPEQYLLLGARSSAENLLHALTVSINYTE